MEMMFLKIMMLIRKIYIENGYVMNALFVTIGIYKGFKLQSSVYNGCHDESVRSFDMNNSAFSDIHDVDHC